MEKGDRVSKITTNPKTGVPEKIVGTIVYKWKDESLVEVDEDDDILARFYGAKCRKIRIKDDLLKPENPDYGKNRI